MGWSSYQDRSPVRAVDSFLEAAYDGDVDEALSYLESPPESVGAHFLTPEALNSDWDIADVSLENVTSFQRIDNSARVNATISGPEGTSITSEFELAESDDEWLITNGLNRMSVDFTSIPMIEINGYHPQIGAEAGDITFHLLPGVYEYYSEGVEGLKPAIKSQLMLGGQSTTIETGVDPSRIQDSSLNIASPQWMTVADDVNELVQSKIESYLNDCFDDIEGPIEEGVFGCPVGTSPSDIAQDVSGDRHADVSNFEWELLEHPQVGAYLDPDPGVFSRLNIRLDELGTTGLSVEVNGEPAALECPLPVSFIEIYFDLDGDMYLGPREEREGLEHDSGWNFSYPEWRECEVQ